MFIHLSHKLDPKDIAFPGEAVLTVEEDSRIGCCGKAFNSVIMHLPNHFGTHLDAPHHFNPEGIDMEQLPDEYFGYKGDEILLLDFPEKNEEGAYFTDEDIKPYAEQLKGKRLLLLRTGFEANRASDPDKYQNRGPSLHPSFCKWLAEETDSLMCVGMDWLSIASPMHDFGVEAHQELLGNFRDRVIVGIEDMSLAPLKDHKIEVLTLGPLRVVGADSAQVNIMALVED